jgi:S-formylglutathione hydrolase FrmB
VSVLRERSLATLLTLTGEVALLTVESRALAGNPLRDPTARTQAVYLPPGYDEHGSTRYPVLYYLPGYGGNVLSNIAAKPWEVNLFQRCDRLIRERRMPAALVVVVDGWTALGGSQYVDSVHNGPYASYIVTEVVAAVDGAFRSRADSRGRAVFGHSSGGFGALHLAMRFPGTFAAVASHSGDGYFRYAAMPSFEKTRRELTRYPTLADFARDFAARAQRSGDLFEAMMTLAYAAAYSPRAASAYAIDLPFSLVSGELDEAVFARWLAFDPVEAIVNPSAAAALSEMALCFVDCGTRDEWSLDVGARVFSERARAQGVAVVHEEFDGAHGDVKHRFERSMLLLLEALEPPG